MLLDTSGLLCFHHAAEPQHEEAVTFFHAAPARITHSVKALTTDAHFEQAGFIRLLHP